MAQVPPFSCEKLAVIYGHADTPAETGCAHSGAEGGWIVKFRVTSICVGGLGSHDVRFGVELCMG